MKFKILSVLILSVLFACSVLLVTKAKAQECVEPTSCSGGCLGWRIVCIPGTATATLRASDGSCYGGWRKTGNWCGACAKLPFFTPTGTVCGQPWAILDWIYCDGSVF